MDYDKLIERLRNNRHPNGLKAQAATAIETLCADLVRATAERDGAEKEITRLKAIMREKGIFIIPAQYPWERSEWNV